MFALLLLLAAPPSPTVAPSPDAAALRNLGLAQLENERPAEAAETFRKLGALTPADPLAWADLAVAELRQQKDAEALTAIEQALIKAPGRGDLLALLGDVHQWGGRDEEALAAYRKAAAAAPDRVAIQYALYRQALQAGSPEGEAALSEALKALVRLRPENLVVVLQSGQRAIAGGDRAGATQAFLRVRELAGTASPAAGAALAAVFKALEEGEVASARVPALRLENVLRPTALFQQSLQELTPGIVGLPVERFAQEPPPVSFGEPAPVRYVGFPIAPGPAPALAVGDFDGDEMIDVAWVRVAREGGAAPRLWVHRGAGGAPTQGPEIPGIQSLLAADLDNDGKTDLLAQGPERFLFLRGQGDGAFVDQTADSGLAGADGTAAAVLDFDIEGDLDLAVAGGPGGLNLYRNALQGPLEAVGPKIFPSLSLTGARGLVASDLDRDGDLDLVVAHSQGLLALDNLRQGRFADRTAAWGITASGPVAAVVSADLDNDGRPDLVAAGTSGLSLWHNRGGRFEAWTVPGLPGEESFTTAVALDADNDGRLDLAAAGPDGAVVLAQRGTAAAPSFEAFPSEGFPRSVYALAAADVDGDGDLDLMTAGEAGVHRLINGGGNRNRWLDVRLRGLTTGNGKNNLQALGAVAEVRAGTAYQFREVAGPVTHFGLGTVKQPDLLRVVWTNGVPQNRLEPQTNQRIVEEQILKGSCPFLYAWTGERFDFVTDLLWNSPLGLPVAPGVWAGADPDELVRVDGARPDGDVYRLRVTEELWEAAWFDAVRLWVVDHPTDVEVASSLKVEPGKRQPVAVLAARGLRPVVGAWDGQKSDVTRRVRNRDEVYGGGYEPGPYQGVAREWTFTFDLGEAPASGVRLLLDGWIFPADASLNLAAAGRPDFPSVPPRLEVETSQGWQVLLPSMGFPAGKTKTMVVDTPPLPPGARRLRIVTSLWLAWDRIAWTRERSDEVPVVRARLSPSHADLRYRGFSRLLRRSPNGPHGYDYQTVASDSPWLPFPGSYTRYGEVSELLETADDRSVILAPGDEIALEFDASGLPPVPQGFRRTVFLQSQGWDKDADRNTFEARHIEPLPFRAMKAYGDPFPETPELREYREKWLTRVLSPSP